MRRKRRKFLRTAAKKRSNGLPCTFAADCRALHRLAISAKMAVSRAKPVRRVSEEEKFRAILQDRRKSIQISELRVCFLRLRNDAAGSHRFSMGPGKMASICMFPRGPCRDSGKLVRNSFFAAPLRKTHRNLPQHQFMPLTRDELRIGVREFEFRVLRFPED